MERYAGLVWTVARGFRLSAAEVGYIVEHSGASVLLVDPELEESLSGSFSGEPYVGDLENGGVSLALGSAEVPQELQDQIMNRYVGGLGGPGLGGHDLHGSRLRRELTDQVRERSEGYDAIAMPTCPAVANEIDASPGSSFRYAALTAPWDHTGQPVISVPCGFTADGLPMVGTLPGKPRVGFAVGFNGHGLAMGAGTAERAVGHLLHGTDPAAAIVQFAAQRGCSTIALATHGRSGLARVVAGLCVVPLVIRGSPPGRHR